MLQGKSLSRRLLIGAAAFIAIALVFATMAIGFALHRFVMGQIDQRLDSQIVFLASLVQATPDGKISVNGATDGPPFDRPGRGWYWQINGPNNILRSQSLQGADLIAPDRPPRNPKLPPRRPLDDMALEGLALDGVRPADGPGPDGRPLHMRVFPTLAGSTPVTIMTSAPRSAVWMPLRSAMITLGLSLLVLGAALVLAMVLQVRLGLRPLEHLRRVIADIRSGTTDRVPDDQPREVMPIVTELNALLVENAANLERARANVANLAHGLKTPLATLSLAVSGRKPDNAVQQDAAQLVALMERRIRHHLGRARMAALSGPARTRVALAPRLHDIAGAMRKIYAEKEVAVSIVVDPALAVACEHQDFDEMAGNLIDNAFKWTRSHIAIHAASAGTKVMLTIEDDGPGLAAGDIATVIRPGARLDETAPGFGFGLPIARELAELYGGELSLLPSPQGGLAATLSLPRAQ